MSSVRNRLICPRPGRTALALSAVLIGLSLLSPAARASLTVSGSVGGAPTGAKHVNFDDLPLGAAGGIASSLNGNVTVSFNTDGKVVTGSVSGQYAAPYLSGSNSLLFNPPGLPNGPDPTKYLTTGRGSVEIVFNDGPQKYLGLLWGSIDTYNSLDFYNGNTLLGTITGSSVLGSPNGDQGVNGTLYVNILSSTAFTRVVARSSSYAFEFDNLSYNAVNPVPEPSTALVALVAGSALGLGAYQKRRAVA